MSGYVLVLAERRDLGADHLVVALAELDADVVRVDPADFPQRVQLDAHLDPAHADGWRTTPRVPGQTCDRAVVVEDLTGIYQGHTGPYRLPTVLDPAERWWADQQAHAGLTGLLATHHQAWLNHPRHLAHASLLPVQLAAAQAAGLAVPVMVITNTPGPARRFAQQMTSAERAVVCRAVANLTIRAPHQPSLRVPPTVVEEDQLGDSIGTTAHLFHDSAPQATHGRLVILDGQTLFPAPAAADSADHAGGDGSAVATPLLAPQAISHSATQMLDTLGLRFAELHFAVDDADRWTFLSLTPQPDLADLDQTSSTAVTHALARALAATHDHR